MDVKYDAGCITQYEMWIVYCGIFFIILFQFKREFHNEYPRYATKLFYWLLCLILLFFFVTSFIKRNFKGLSLMQILFFKFFTLSKSSENDDNENNFFGIKNKSNSVSDPSNIYSPNLQLLSSSFVFAPPKINR